MPSPERKDIELLDATYGKGKGFKYYHDENKEVHYTYVEAGAVKCRVDGVWYIAVFYRGADGMLRSTVASRWTTRFKRMY